MYAETAQFLIPAQRQAAGTLGASLGDNFAKYSSKIIENQASGQQMRSLTIWRNNRTNIKLLFKYRRCINFLKTSKAKYTELQTAHKLQSEIAKNT